MAGININQAAAERWATGFLKYIGAPASSVDDRRVRFLAAQYMHEAVGGSNPLAITNAEGQKTTFPEGPNPASQQFKNVTAGYKALNDYFVNQGITGYLNALKDPASTVNDLTQALAGAGWEGHDTPKSRAASAAYANAIGGAAGATQPVPVPTVQMTPPAASTSTGTTPTPTDTGVPAPGAGVFSGLNNGAFNQTTENSLMTPYNGPNAYKGFDLSGLTKGTPDYEQAIRAIDGVAAEPGGVGAMMNSIQSTFGSEAWMASQPELRTLLVTATYNNWAPNQFQSAVERTQWWSTTSDNYRLWQENSNNDPGQVKAAMAQLQNRIVGIADGMGTQLTQQQLNKISNVAIQQSVTTTGAFSNTAFTDSQIKQMVAQDTNVNQSQTAAQGMSGQPSTSSVPGTPGWVPNPAPQPVSSINGGGDIASLVQKFTQIAHDFYLPLTPGQINSQVQKYMQNDIADPNFISNASAGFEQYAIGQAKMLYPAWGSAIGTTSSTGNAQNMYRATSTYRNLIAQYTGQSNPDSIDLRSPQYSWILSGAAPPSATAQVKSGPNGPANPAVGAQGTGAPPAIDVLQRYLMQQPAFQSTDMGKNMGWQIGSAITKAFGYS